METKKLSLEISRLVHYGLQRGLIAQEDEAYARQPDAGPAGPARV